MRVRVCLVFIVCYLHVINSVIVCVVFYVVFSTKPIVFQIFSVTLQRQKTITCFTNLKLSIMEKVLLSKLVEIKKSLISSSVELSNLAFDMDKNQCDVYLKLSEDLENLAFKINIWDF